MTLRLRNLIIKTIDKSSIVANNQLVHDLALSYAGNGFIEAKDLKLIARMYSMTSDLLKTNHMKKRAQDVFCHSSGFNFLKNNRICQNRTTEHKTSVRAISRHIKGYLKNAN